MAPVSSIPELGDFALNQQRAEVVSELDMKFDAVLVKSPAKGDWTYVVTAATRDAIDKQAGDTVTITLAERIH